MQHKLGVPLILLVTSFLTGNVKSKKNVGGTTSCMPMTINVYADRNAIVESPNYPKKFGAQTQCKWIFNAPEGFRVKIHFVKFYLLEANNQGACMMQFLTLSDTFTGNTDGRYCGNTLPPVLRSTGRSVVVSLESDASDVINRYYSGFRLKASATLELPSPRIRDDGGRWRKYVTARPGPGGQFPMTRAPVTSPTSTLDPNNPSAEIEARNNQINQRNNQQNDNQQNDFNSYEPILPTFRPTRRSTTRRTATTRTSGPSGGLFGQPIAMTNPPLYNVPNTINYPDRSLNPDDEEEGDTPIALWIAIILISLVALISIIIFIVLLLRRKKKKKKRSEENYMRQSVAIPGRAHKRTSHSMSPRRNHRHSSNNAQVQVSTITRSHSTAAPSVPPRRHRSPDPDLYPNTRHSGYHHRPRH